MGRKSGLKVLRMSGIERMPTTRLLVSKTGAAQILLEINAEAAFWIPSSGLRITTSFVKQFLTFTQSSSSVRKPGRKKAVKFSQQYTTKGRHFQRIIAGDGQISPGFLAVGIKGFCQGVKDFRGFSENSPVTLLAMS